MSGKSPKPLAIKALEQVQGAGRGDHQDIIHVSLARQNDPARIISLDLDGGEGDN